MRGHSWFTRLAVPVVVAAVAAFAPAGAFAGSAGAAQGEGRAGFGPNTFVFSPDMPQSQIQATVDAVANLQVSSQFGTHRFALLFEPGTYGSAANPLIFQVGYYTSVAGLGVSPGDVTINGAIDVFNTCDPGGCTALVNFWRSLSNLTINVTLPAQPPAYSPIPQGSPACLNSAEFWATAQAAPVRRVHVNGFFSLMDYCSSPAFASGGFIADSQFSNSTVLNGSQQQFIVRNSQLDGWTNGVWDQVFSGTVGAPAQCFPSQASCGGPYTTLATSPVTREAPYLFVDAVGHFRVFVPSPRRDSAGTSWASGPTPGRSLPIERFFVARPEDSVEAINRALRRGQSLILTPGIYHLERSIEVTRPDTIVLGLGLATLAPEHGIVAMRVDGAKGDLLSGLLFDAGPTSSPALLRIGSGHEPGDRDEASASDPSAVQDVFFRIGGAGVGRAATSLVVDSSDVIIDDIWAWRADHGSGVGWATNTADTGVVVNGDDVTAYGLFVEHYQKHQVIWNGNRGTDVFFQNEMPYDPPSQAAWMEAPGVPGWAAFKVSPRVARFTAYGLASYSFFNQGVDIFAANAFEAPRGLPPGSLHDLLTVFLSRAARGGILNVVNGVGGPSTIANADVPVTVVSYPP